MPVQKVTPLAILNQWFQVKNDNPSAFESHLRPIHASFFALKPKISQLQSALKLVLEKNEKGEVLTPEQQQDIEAEVSPSNINLLLEECNKLKERIEELQKGNSSNLKTYFLSRMGAQLEKVTPILETLNQQRFSK